MSYTEGLIRLKLVVQKALLASKLPKREYFNLFENAIDVYKDLRLYRLKEGIAVAKCTKSAINTISFPDDFVDFVAVGVPIDGKIYRLTSKDDMVITTTLSGTTETQDSDQGEGVELIDSNVYGFTARGGNNIYGYYKIDWDNRRVFLNSVTQTTILLAYKSMGTKFTEETYIPVKYLDAMIAGILWRFFQYNPQFLKIASYYEDQYTKAVSKLDDGYTLDELLDTLFETYSLLPAR